MSAVPSSIKAAHEPQVNLLPPDVAQRRAAGKQRSYILLGLVAFIAAAIGVAFLAGSGVASAKAELARVQAQGADLQAQIDSYSHVAAVMTELDSARRARTFVGSTEILWADFFALFAVALPDGATIDNLTWTASDIFAVADSGDGPFSVPDLGSVEIDGKLPSYISGADIEDALNAVPGLARARISTVAREDNEGAIQYSYTGSVRLTALALSGRFSDEWQASWARFSAQLALSKSSEAAAAQLATAQAALEAGEPGASADVAAATLHLDSATAEADLFDSYLAQALSADQTVKDLEADIRAAQPTTAVVTPVPNPTASSVPASQPEPAPEPSANPELDAMKAALATATEVRDAFDLPFQQLVTAINAWYGAAQDLAYMNSRVIAQRAILASVTSELDASRAALNNGEDGAADRLNDAERAVAIAQAAETAEEAALELVTTAMVDARTAVDAAFVAMTSVTPIDTTGDEGSA